MKPRRDNAITASALALALVGVSQISACCSPNVTSRPLTGMSPVLTTYLPRADTAPSESRR